MIGIKYVKTPPTMFVQQYKGGEIKREGIGLSFMHYAPTTTLVAIPIGTNEAPFIFDEITADFQEVTLQGNITYRIAEPGKIANLLDFTLNGNGHEYATDDPQKLEQRIINLVTVAFRKELKAMKLRQALKATDHLAEAVYPLLAEAKEIKGMGIEIMGLAILGIRPAPETARALEAEAREQILKEADDAIYFRRNAAVEQERIVKENELKTEVAIENKKKQIQDAKMEAEKAKQEKQHALRATETNFKVEQEAKRKELVDLAAENTKKEAEAKAYGMAKMMAAIDMLDVKALQAIAMTGMQPEQLIANAFQELAGNADKIGQLNITPDLLTQIMGKNAAA
ncbi:MAG: SPFH domain-containing protein [Verrucomicrobiota bacterium]